MAAAKITISLEDDQVRAIRESVTAGRSTSISDFVKHAVNMAIFDAAEWRTMLDDALRQTGGPPTEDERAWADALLNPPERNKVCPGSGNP